MIVYKKTTKTKLQRVSRTKKEMDNALADGDVDNIDTMFEWMSDRARAGKSGRGEPNK